MLGFTCRGARLFPALGGWILLFATTIRIGFPDCVSVVMTGQKREIPWFWSYYDSIAILNIRVHRLVVYRTES